MTNNSALTPQEVADLLNIAKNTVYELIKRGDLNAYKVGRKIRVDMNDVDTYKNKTKSLNTVKTSIDMAEIELSSAPKSVPPSVDEAQQKKGFIICGQDVMLDILSRYLEMQLNGFQAFRSYVGSYNGLYAMYQGNVQLATCHLWDGDTDQYNIPYIRRMLPGVPAVIIHLACRMQGFYVAKGNPKGITGWDDLKRTDITMTNREKGSGTRVLLDEHLRKLGIPSKIMKGYEHECTSHLAVASAVARGEADLGIGNEKSGLQVLGIDFIPLQTERYELVMKKEDFDKPPYETVLKILRSPEFKSELEGIGGYDLTEMGKIVAET